MLRHETESIVWETDCRLLIAGDSDIGLGLGAGDCSYGGICYSVENDNPLVRCPFGRKECSAIPKDFILPMCPCHRTFHAYDYAQSMERVQAEANIRQKTAYMALTGGRYCACVEVDNGQIKAAYDVGQCIRNNCKNEYCVLRREKRDLHIVNIYYDVRRTWITRTGLLEDTRIKLTKGMKVFPKGVARTDAEIWLHQNQDYGPFQSKCVHQSPTDPSKAGIQDFAEFCYQAENIRISHRCKRDPQEDRRDEEMGIEVVYTVEEERRQAEEKRAIRAQKKERKYTQATQPPQNLLEQITIF